MRALHGCHARRLLLVVRTTRPRPPRRLRTPRPPLTSCAARATSSSSSPVTRSRCWARWTGAPRWPGARCTEELTLDDGRVVALRLPRMGARPELLTEAEAALRASADALVGQRVAAVGDLHEPVGGEFWLSSVPDREGGTIQDPMVTGAVTVRPSQLMAAADGPNFGVPDATEADALSQVLRSVDVQAHGTPRVTQNAEGHPSFLLELQDETPLELRLVDEVARPRAPWTASRWWSTAGWRSRTTARCASPATGSRSPRAHLALEARAVPPRAELHAGGLARGRRGGAPFGRGAGAGPPPELGWFNGALFAHC